MRNVPILVALAALACSTPKQKSPEPAPAAATPAAPQPAAAAPTAHPECARAAATEELAPVQDPLAELSALGEEVLVGGPDAGGSIRAKREPPVERVRANPCRLRAKVEEVLRGRFPLAAVRVRILEPPKDGPGVALAKNDVVVVLPRLATERGRVRLEDPVTAQNASAFYLSKGDRVHLLLDSERADGVWWAEAIARD